MRTYYNTGITHNRRDPARAARAAAAHTTARADETDAAGAADAGRPQPDATGLTTINLYLYTALRRYCAMRAISFVPLLRARPKI